LSGDVSDDSQALIRKRVHCALPPTDDILALLSEIPPENGGLWPLGNEIRLYGGIKFDDGTEEMSSMGIFRIARPEIARTAEEMTIVIEGFDRGRSVSRAKFVEPYGIAKNTNYCDAIKDLILSRLSWFDVNDFMCMDTEYLTPSLTFTDEDPWQVAQDMAKSFGAELFFDGDGKLVLQPEPDPVYTPSSFTYESGEEATVTQITRDLNDEDAYNGVVVTATNSQLLSPIKAVAWDTDTNSPTRYDPDSPEDSLYGAVPLLVDSEYITDGQQAQDAANATLARVTGLISHCDFNAINNPAHISGDIVTIRDSKVGIDSVYILDSVQIGVGENFEMTGATRKRRVT